MGTHSLNITADYSDFYLLLLDYCTDLHKGITLSQSWCLDTGSLPICSVGCIFKGLTSLNLNFVFLTSYCPTTHLQYIILLCCKFLIFMVMFDCVCAVCVVYDYILFPVFFLLFVRVKQFCTSARNNYLYYKLTN